jgi:hypothetical protein
LCFLCLFVASLDEFRRQALISPPISSKGLTGSRSGNRRG